MCATLIAHTIPPQVYFGAHITSKEQAAAVLPEGPLREYFLPHFKAPGCLSIQQWEGWRQEDGSYLGADGKSEGSPIKWVVIAKADAKYVPPLPRLRIMTPTERLASIPMDVIKEVLEKHGITLASRQEKESLVRQLSEQAESIHEEVQACCQLNPPPPHRESLECSSTGDAVTACGAVQLLLVCVCLPRQALDAWDVKKAKSAAAQRAPGKLLHIS